MSDFRYKISVVIPVYNCEKFISPCVESLNGQTMPTEDFQIVFVNDGSKDKSGKICRDFAELNENIVYYEKENGGVSSARNKGIELAEGKYIMFLDADDALGKGSLEAIYKFFEEHFEETDLVTYSIDYINEKGAVSTHKRFDVMSHSGIYDINSNTNIIQTTMNICIKNVPENERILFDESLSLGEDQWFIFSWLLKKQKLGYVKEAVYKYFRHSGSASSMFNSPYYCFEQYTEFLRKLLNASRDKDGKPHPTAQALVVYNLGWRLTSDMLVSHADAETEGKQYAVLREIMSEVDTSVICNSIYIDPFHVECFMRLKNEPCEISVNGSAMSASSGGNLWFAQAHAIVFNTFRVHNGKIQVSGYVKNGVLDFKELKLYYSDIKNNLHEIPMYDTAFSYYKSKMQTNLFGGFDAEIDFDGEEDITFILEINGEKVVPVPYFGFKCAVNRTKFHVATGEYVIKFEAKSKSFSVKKAKASELAAARNAADSAVGAENRNALIYRKIFAKIKKNEEIWLYCDRENIFDNAYYQFLHDFDKNDGVKRYYIIDNLKDKKKYFNAKQRKYLVNFKSFKHKMLFFNCKKIFTSFNSLSIFSPFDGLPLKWYSDITDYEIIYLQHGILHARLPLLYTKEKANVDKVVISSEFERENFKKIYNFNDSELIMSGMPRFDTIDTEKKAQRKILFSPSWRKNLIGEYENNTRVLYVDKFKESVFYKEINAFLNSEKLAEILEKYDLTLDFKNHPIFADYDRLFEVKNPRVRVTQDKNEMQDYLAMITDYSSIVFDFVYLNRPIVYFVPDYEQFKAGITHGYNQLDLPLEEGFGDVNENYEQLIDSIEYLASHDFVPKPVYAERMENFFVSRKKDHAESLYNAMKKN